ncbi:MAG: response regulator [Hyphomicrobiaceae bacterium]|nr:response regulator [Hyphomicrobiaceae bacterium]
MAGSLADLIAPELPYLRRFARALTGTQERGDSYVVALLEALIADQRQFDGTLSPRTALYKSFINIWNALPTNEKAEPVMRERGEVVDRRIETLTPRPRQAFLLASVEEFEEDAIASILSCTEVEVEQLISQAGREIADQIAANVLIIEDEPLIAMEIENLVTDIGHDVVGIARTRAEAVKIASERKPGLVLADIQLADGSSGIDAVNDILKAIEIPVVFITAYPERLLTGERAEPTFLVSKPFRQEMVKAVISQALFFEVKAGAARA